MKFVVIFALNFYVVTRFQHHVNRLNTINLILKPFRES